MENLESKNLKEKTKQDAKLLETFLRNEKSDSPRSTKHRARRIIINKHLADFIRSVTEDYEPSSLSLKDD